MKTTSKIALGTALALVLVGLSAWGFFRALGVRSLYFNHVIATFEINGLSSLDEVRALQERFSAAPGMRTTTFTRSAWSNQTWMARIQFRALNPAAGRKQIREWVRSMPTEQTLRPLHATFYDCRLIRPSGGDLVFGKSQQILLRN